MGEFVGPFLDNDGELVLGEYRFTDEDIAYFKDVNFEEAKRTLADIGAATVLIEGRHFTELDRVVIECETLPLQLSNGETFGGPGKAIAWGIAAAQIVQDPDRKNVHDAQKEIMDQIGLTAQSMLPKR